MVAFARSDRMCIEELLGMGSGYVMDLSNREFSEVLRAEAGIDIDDPTYADRGGSKANRLRSFFDKSDAGAVAEVLRALWEHRELRSWTPGDIVEPRPAEVRERFMAVVARLERQAGRSDTEALGSFVEGATLEQLVEAINRDVAAGRHAASLDRLHTYCMKRFMHLLDEVGVPCTREEPLQSRVGKYVRWLREETGPSAMTLQILKNAMGILQQFNDIRNNRSFAHDNEVVDADEARLIFETVVAILRFVESRSPQSSTTG
ncbi:abortive infection family protein [Erythrobacter sp. LQ02-29]|jgi:hypothetical protein|uniref:abortive infection family protein n=1 Tax=Erythrobacteraceae TaxID=335929 RepID=UPI001C87F15F|nr:MULTISPECIES: abortive infection family protein [Erythrobacteraceae]MBX7536086.1 abortive infection family protein [Qipengyuania aestuarii]MCP9222149.1 abortive infection family protein [Erythrobacter sp. LQ02-29]|tara:strand:+ start:1303 stop:2088 length:786 start_codon:yes stop_codon:yes gene_type:complete